ncbi:hypothetical protein [Umezawaea beigongshangensis]|uniref:hypothetical protein n=1 Tax=Umezawaea beigongshangensis TaxID=2780383 RepID=UPI0018F22318|nr:hypothetical protein [Umezawaea beigongshangensis]
MQVQALNKRAQERYDNFVSAMDLVAEQFDPLSALIKKMQEGKAPPGAFRITSPEQLRKLHTDALKALTELREQAKKYEAELKSRDWRV